MSVKTGHSNLLINGICENDKYFREEIKLFRNKMIYELSLMHYLLANVTLNLFLIIVVNCSNFERFIVEICYILLPLFQNH